MFNRFTERARRILVLAQQEAVKLQSDHIGTEHLLLGLAGDPESVASKALESLNINLNTMRSQIVEKLGRTPVERQEINYTPRAKKALELALNYVPPVQREDIRLAGPSGKYALDMAVADLRKTGKASPYDLTVCEALAKVLTGGEKGDWTNPMKEDDILKLERDEFMKLARRPETLARIEHMLDTGKPLRN